jgi:hypothetical protein
VEGIWILAVGLAGALLLDAVELPLGLLVYPAAWIVAMLGLEAMSKYRGES